MTPEQEKKQKILAVVTVIGLFLFVGGLLWQVSVNNRNKTEALKATVLAQRKEAENFNKLAQISFNSASTTLTAKSIITLGVTPKGNRKIIYQANENTVLPIASLTKLMTAVVAIDNLNLDTEITATLDYIGQEESYFVLETDRKYTVRELLANTLIASDNDSARLLSSALGEANFIAKMNTKAQELNMLQTKFFNVTGLDPKDPKEGINVSTVNDLAILMNNIITKYPLITTLTSQKEYNFCDTKNYCKMIQSTDKLFADEKFTYRILGGKTGSTDLAGKNLLLAVEIMPNITLVNIVLGSADSFKDTTNIINNLIINK